MRLYLAGISTAAYLIPKLPPEVNALVSYLESWRPKRKYFDRLFLDSGAFTAWSQGTEINLKKYVAYCHEHQKQWDIIAGLDVIGDWQASKLNYLDMRSEGLNILPTFHVGEPWEFLEWLCSEWKYVAIGGMVPYLSSNAPHFKKPLIRFLIKSHGIAAKARCRLHGFGLTTWEIVKMFNWESIDSTSFLAGQKFGRALGVKGSNTQNTNFYEVAKRARNLGLNYSAEDIRPSLNKGNNTQERYEALVLYNIYFLMNAVNKLNKARGHENTCDI